MKRCERGKTMKKKSVSAFVATSLICGALLTPSALANSEVEVEPIQQNEQVEEMKNFLEIKGKISKIVEKTKGNLYYAEVGEGEESFGMYFDNKTMIVNNAGKQVNLKEGMEFTAFVDTRKPMILIYPPQYTPELIVVQTEEAGAVQLDKLDKLDKDFLNENKDVVIHLSDKTVITNLSGTKLKAEDVPNKDIVFFYEVVLESYPAQIGPSKVIVLEYDEETPHKEVQEIINADHYEINGVKMIPLRIVAEQLGYKVESTGNGAIISKGALSFTITRESKMYGYNKALRYFEEAPALLEENKTYVPEEFLDLLIEHL